MHAGISSKQYISPSVLNTAGKSKLCVSIDCWLRIQQKFLFEADMAETFKKFLCPKFHKSYHQCPLLDSVLTEMNPVHIFKNSLFRSFLILSVQLSKVIPSGRWQKYLNVNILQTLENCLLRRLCLFMLIVHDIKTQVGLSV